MAPFQRYCHCWGSPGTSPKLDHSRSSLGGCLQSNRAQRACPGVQLPAPHRGYFPTGLAAARAAPLATPTATPLASLCFPWLERAGGAWPRGRSALGVGPRASPSAVTPRHAPLGRTGGRAIARAPAALSGDVPDRGRARALELPLSGCHGVGGAD